MLQNQDSPNYESAFYREIKHKLEFINDMYVGRPAWFSPLEGLYSNKVNYYLPKENNEPSDQYMKRVSSSYFYNLFRDSIQSTAGFLDFTLNNDVFESIIEYRDNIDGKGNSLEVFFNQADIAALRDGFCCILVDYPTDSVETIKDERELKRRPYLVLVERKDIINARVNHGFSHAIPINQLTIKQGLIEPDGAFGEKLITQYRVIGEGWYQVWQEEDREPGLITQDSYSLPYLPLVFYSLTGLEQDLLATPIPLYDLGEMALQLFQKQSNRDEIIHKLCPFLQIEENNPGALGDEELSIGPNTYIKNCRTTFVSPGPEAIGPIQDDIDKLIEAMRLKTLAFQSGNRFGVTATEINREVATSEANLINMARRKESCIQSIFGIWAEWENKPGIGGSIEVNAEVIGRQLDSARVELYLALNERGILSSEQLLEILREGQLLNME